MLNGDKTLGFEKGADGGEAGNHVVTREAAVLTATDGDQTIRDAVLVEGAMQTDGVAVWRDRVGVAVYGDYRRPALSHVLKW